MADKIYNVLFLCTGNSARSIMAEVMLSQLGRGRFRAYSAGSHPTGNVNPYALATLEASGLPTKGLRSKGWEEFAAAGAPAMDFILTVCDSAAGEACPVWPGKPITAHWGVADPAAIEGSHEKRAAAFREAAATLRRRIELLVALKVDKLERSAVKAKLKEMGNI